MRMTGGFPGGSWVAGAPPRAFVGLPPRSCANGPRTVGGLRSRWAARVMVVGTMDPSPQALGVTATPPASEPYEPALPPRDLDYAFVRERAYAALFEEPAPEQRLGRYVLLGTLGRGGMGMVLEAFDRTLDRRVAVKVLHRQLDERQRRRLVREAQALAKLSHPNVVQVYDVGEADGQVFIAMELVRGRSLWSWQQSPRPSWRALVGAYAQAGEGLAAAHAQGLVHRDFKPGNAIIDDEGRVRVLDFGLARQAVEGEPSERKQTDAALEDEGTALATPLTRTGAVLGTPAYMPLEQMTGQPTDARSDQFSFCVALYEALYGERPFEGRSLQALAQALERGEIRPAPRGAAVPEALRRVLLRGLRTDPSQRWPSMAALLLALRRPLAPRRRAVWVLGVVGGVAVGVGVSQYARGEPPCEGATAHLEGVWDDAAAQQVKAAILGTGLSYAPDTWPRVQARLDAYARTWAERHTEVCRATSVRREQSPAVMDLRMECLQSRRVALREAVGVLAHADATRVERAVALVAELPALSTCDDVEALRAELPPPQDSRVAAQVEALREQLVEARALLDAGAYAEGLRRAKAVTAQAEALGYGPLLAEAQLVRGHGHQAVAEYAAAEQDVEGAYLLAVEQRHADVEASAASRLIWVVGFHQARLDAGLQWGRTALALAKSRRGEPVLEARVHGGVGVLLARQGKLPEALDRFQRALALFEAALGPDHPHVAKTLENVANVRRSQGELAKARADYERALAIGERALGPKHPGVARSLGNLGALLADTGELAEALVHHRRALGILEGSLGPDHPDVATSLTNVGIVQWRQGRLDEALIHQRRALAIFERALGPDHPDVLRAVESIGGVLWSRGDLDGALAHQQRVLATRERVLGPDHPDVATSLNNVGAVLWKQGELDGALAHQQRALAIMEEALGPRHPHVAQTLTNVAEILAEQGQPNDALTLHRRALAIMEDALGPRHPGLAATLLGIAVAASQTQDLELAREHAERAVALREASGAAPHELAEARWVLARVSWPAKEQRARARTLAEDAAEAYAGLGAAHQGELAEVRAWLAEHPAP
jgi:eukaryotic-like serine/threonine-protein kinase